MKSIPDNHEWAIRYLRGVLTAIRRGRTSPNAWLGCVDFAMSLGVTTAEVHLLVAQDARLRQA